MGLLRFMIVKCGIVFAVVLLFTGVFHDHGIRDTWADSTDTRSFDLTIQDRKMSGDLSVIRVTQDDMVELRWTTDEVTTIHLHGYNIEKRITSETTTVMTFEAYATGRFPITSHGFGEHTHEHTKHKPLLYLEVHPK